MTAATIIKQLDQLIKLHTSLMKLAVEKTEAIKNSDMETIDKLMKDEQQHVKAISQIETARQKEVDRLLLGSNNNSLWDLISITEGVEKEKLTTQREQLLRITQELRNQNNINQQLIYQSLQFVNLSLDLMRPQKIDSFNYEKPAGAKNGKQAINRGMFDSKA